jgi:hypothetical protein
MATHTGRKLFELIFNTRISFSVSTRYPHINIIFNNVRAREIRVNRRDFSYRADAVEKQSGSPKKSIAEFSSRQGE